MDSSLVAFRKENISLMREIDEIQEFIDEKEA